MVASSLIFSFSPCLPRPFELERAVLAEQIPLTALDIKLEITVAQKIAGIVHRLKRAPRGVSQTLHHPERGVMPEQIAAVRTMQFNPESLMSQIVAGIIF
jgi:hypothetical protein